MTAINFKKQFAPMIADGTKTHTIRRKRKSPIQKDDWLQLYTGMRTKNCQRLAVRMCVEVQPIIIDPLQMKVIIGDCHLNVDEINKLAHDDGFEDTYDFFEFFSEVLDSEMVIIHWGRE